MFVRWRQLPWGFFVGVTVVCGLDLARPLKSCDDSTTPGTRWLSSIWTLEPPLSQATIGRYGNQAVGGLPGVPGYHGLGKLSKLSKLSGKNPHADGYTINWRFLQVTVCTRMLCKPCTDIVTWLAS
jgi:hypothetical protein